jgi:hypothetical protein
MDDDFAKQKTAGNKNNHPGKIGKRSPMIPIIKKIIPNKR